MTEAEIVAQMATHGDRVWMVLQYWTSISFAVLVASHLTKGQVNGWVVAIALIFYAAFSWLMSTMIVFDGEVVSGGLAALNQMKADGHSLNAVSEAFLHHAPLTTDSDLRRTVRVGTVIGMFALTCAYPIYCHYTAKSALD